MLIPQITHKLGLYEMNAGHHSNQMTSIAQFRMNLASFASRKIQMSNNDIMKKLRVALKLRDTDIILILKLVDYDITSSELGAIFRTEDHPNYKECGDQLLRNFLNGLIIHLRGPAPEKTEDSQKQVVQKTGPKKLFPPKSKS